MFRISDLAKAHFSGHESFPFRYGWLKKGHDGLRQDPLFLSEEQALVKLGVGKNMVYSIRHWLVVLGLAELTDGKGRKRALHPTALARQLFDDDGWDPYLEDHGTLWLLHHAAATSNERATTWWWAFHRPQTATLRRTELLDELNAGAQESTWRSSPNTIKRDVDCFIRTYHPSTSGRATLEDAISCPLTALGLLQPTSTKDEYVLSYGFQASLPDAIFRWGLSSFLGDRSEGTVSLDELQFGENAPGRVFRLNREAIIERLLRLNKSTDGVWTYDETIGLRQLVLRGYIDPAHTLAAYYRLDANTIPTRQLALAGAA